MKEKAPIFVLIALSAILIFLVYKIKKGEIVPENTQEKQSVIPQLAFPNIEIPPLRYTNNRQQYNPMGQPSIVTGAQNNCCDKCSGKTDSYGYTPGLLRDSVLTALGKRGVSQIADNLYNATYPATGSGDLSSRAIF